MKSVIIVGLGNPDGEYKGTRHNAGRDAARFFAHANKQDHFELHKKSNSLVTEVSFGKNGEARVILPETFMNKSGNAVGAWVKPKKELKNLIVIHDDLDIPVGRYKISFGKNSGGHKGVESVMRAVKTKNFVRIRIGVAPKKKPSPDKMLNFIIGKFSPAESLLIKKNYKKIAEALEVMITDSLERAMSEYH